MFCQSGLRVRYARKRRQQKENVTLVDLTYSTQIGSEELSVCFSQSIFPIPKKHKIHGIEINNGLDSIKNC